MIRAHGVSVFPAAAAPPESDNMNFEGIEGGASGGGPTLTADEQAFFESGGEKGIPTDETGGGAGGDAGGAGDGAAAGAGTDKPGATGDNQGGEGKGNQHVPLATFLEEKKARKDLATQLADAQRQIAEFTGKFSIIERLKLAGADPGTEQPAAPPTPEEDIFGAVKHVGETVAQMQKRLDDQAAAEKQARETATAQTEFVNRYRNDAETFQKANADYRTAYDFLLQSRAAELQAIGYDTPEALHQALIADETAIAEMAFAKNKSPAEMIYALAKQRGYKMAAADPSKGKGAEKLDAIERGQAANKSLSSTGGSAGDADMTAEALIAMPAAEFEAWCDKNPAKAKRLFGG
ncbi:hypothetical protein [Bradyrhizobium pachyrhizi]|uniref:hypothetical protein n=1 Tax=Bradyrhizobium pachyrhizi TaxID=280333 RepID=UPI00067D8287|nr:hypothetical protein [Bradyrhizobium pachyrhizi]